VGVGGAAGGGVWLWGPAGAFVLVVVECLGIDCD
jgi:hypothetical protein